MEVNNRCSKCKHFDRYYTKGVTHFNKTVFGWCTKKHESLNVHDCCERYEAGTRTRGISRRAKICINDLLTEITAIRNVIEAEASGEQEE